MMIGMGTPNNHSRIPRPIISSIAANACIRSYEHILCILRSARTLNCRLSPLHGNRIPPISDQSPAFAIMGTVAICVGIDWRALWITFPLPEVARQLF